MNCKFEDIKQMAQKHVLENDVPESIKEDTKDLIVKIMTHEAYGNKSYKWQLDDFEISTRLGEGTFGRVLCP